MNAVSSVMADTDHFIKEGYVSPLPFTNVMIIDTVGSVLLCIVF